MMRLPWTTEAVAIWSDWIVLSIDWICELSAAALAHEVVEHGSRRRGVRIEVLDLRWSPSATCFSSPACCVVSASTTAASCWSYTVLRNARNALSTATVPFHGVRRVGPVGRDLHDAVAQDLAVVHRQEAFGWTGRARATSGPPPRPRGSAAG